MRHSSWTTFHELLAEFARKYGGSIYDRDARRSWDPGQFACRLVYGKEWNTDPRFLADDQLPEDDPVPRNAIELLRAVLKNGLPEWTKVEEERT